MKLQTWLLLSYLIVMLLPLLGAYGLFVWVSTYYEERNVEENMEMFVELNELQAVLARPGFYRVDADFGPVDELASSRVSMTLFAANGYRVHATDPLKPNPLVFTARKQLYEGFYEMKQKFGTISYKEPVFEDGRVVGIYEIEWMREEWVAGVGQRTWVVAGLFAAFFLLLFAAVAILVNHRLNRPLRELSSRMAAFAKGETVEPMQKRSDEIGDLSKNFETMREELTRANESLAKEQQQKEFMIASISHDLKTPLTSVRAYAEALHSELLTLSERQEYYGIIIAKANHIRQMLDDLLTYTLLQSGAYEMERTAVDGGEFFDMVTSGYETLCGEKGIELQVEVEVETELSVNTKQMVRVVDNLMDNAIRHTDAGGMIGLAAADAGAAPGWCYGFVKTALNREQGVYIIVQNEGQGVTEETIRNAFNPLYQADQARTKTGTGLGLAITKEVMDRHGGTVQMLSEKRIGTAVICWLPAIKREEFQ